MTTPTRRPYTGSCHCGSTRYVLYLTLPHTPFPAPEDNTERRAPSGVQLIYRCNCTICHKAGILHTMPTSPPDDFMLLAPADPADLGDYRTRENGVHWYFCKTCGMRCFGFVGPGEVVDIDLDTCEDGIRKILVAGNRADERGPVKVWRPKKEGWQGYLSINAISLDAGQEGLDLREWTDKEWVMYIDLLDLKGDGNMATPRYDVPHEGGMY